MTILRDLWSILTPRQRRWALLMQLLSIVMAFSTITGIAAIGPFFAVLGDPGLIGRTRALHWLYVHSGADSLRAFEVRLGVAFALMLCIANFVTAAGSYVLIRVAGWISCELQVTLFGDYLSRPFLFHIRTHSAVLLNNLLRDTTRGVSEVLQSIFTLVTTSVTAIFIMISIWVVNPLIAPLVLAILGGGYVLIYLTLRGRLQRAGRRNARHFQMQTKIVNESLAAIRDVALMRAHGFFQQQFASSSRALTRAIGRTQAVAQLPRQLMECIAVLGLVSAALLTTSSNGGIAGSLGQLTFLGFAAYRLLPTLQQAFTAVVRIRTEQPAFALVAEDLRAARAAPPPVLQHEPLWQERPQQAIRLLNVSFRYEPGRPAALHDMSVSITARTVTGIIGANGSGKTTLADVIAGLLSPDTGRLEVDGVTIDDSNRAAWQQRIAYVPQQIFLLDASIAANVALGVAQQEIDQERVRTCVQLAQLDELVETLPDGYEHRVGERGVTLSGGQRQRLGIARALYRNASVLILDEATNALDGLTEQELMSTLLRLRGRYTLVLIAHRLHTLRACDMIFELDRGVLTGGGSYAQLLEQSSRFRELVQAVS
jgi:ATP-binding cassette, subfamily B, bacterial PglK